MSDIDIVWAGGVIDLGLFDDIYDLLLHYDKWSGFLSFGDLVHFAILDLGFVGYGVCKLFVE